MNGNQTAAFTTGTGNIFTAGDLSFVIAGFLSVMLFLYVSWLCIEAYKNYGEKRLNETDFLITILRGVGLMSFVLFVSIYF